MVTIQKSIETKNKPVFLPYNIGQGIYRESKIQYGDTLQPVFSQKIGTDDSVSSLEILDVGERSVKLTSDTPDFQVYKYNLDNHCIEEHKMCYLPHELCVSLQGNDNLGVFMFSSSALFFYLYGSNRTGLRIGRLPNLDHNENEILYCNLILQKTRIYSAYTLYAVSIAGDLAAVVRPQREKILSIDIVSISKSIDLDGKHTVKGKLLKSFEIALPLTLERFTDCDLVCDDQMLLVVTWSNDNKRFSFIGISLQSCELKYCKSINITERCVYFKPTYFILNGNNGVKDLLLFIVADKERKIQMYSLGNNFELVNECKLGDISFFEKRDTFDFQVSNDVLFISTELTDSMHVIKCSRDRLYEMYRLDFPFVGEDDCICTFSVIYNGFEAVFFNDRCVEDEEGGYSHETYIDVFHIPKSSFSLYGLCRLAIKNMVKRREEIESLPVPKDIKKELCNMI